MLVDANYGGTKLFTSTSATENFKVGEQIKVSASLDATPGEAIIQSAAVSGVNGTTAGAGIASYAVANGVVTSISLELRIYGEATVNGANGTAAGEGSKGAIGTIGLDGKVTGSNAVKIDSTTNATVAAHILDAALDDIEEVLANVDNSTSALKGVKATTEDVMSAADSAIESMSAADITTLMAEMSQSKQGIEYATAVWSAQRSVETSILQATQKALG